MIIALIVIGILIAFFFIRQFLLETQKKMSDTFKSLSFDVMEKNSRSFLDVAKIVMDKYQEGIKGELENKHQAIENILNPVKESLNKIDEYSRALEKQRESSYSGLSKQIESLLNSENILRKEAVNLSNALRSHNTRGSWGQLHLKRVLELSGMLNNCDFFEQPSQTQEGITLRPDMVINLPGNRQIVIDAKTPLDAYLESMDITDEGIKFLKLKEHASQIKKHIKELSSKEYHKFFDSSPEYVILFLPSEAFFSSALQADPNLLEEAALNNIILAAPTTLIAILKAVAYSWKQESVALNAKEIAKIGKELDERLTTM
ncbi:MAG: DNA recombination protein RmuC, partial [Chlamydiae bacterium]|nr:DNA recombination protein RmuC [Chlamydiota bacterium]